MEKKAFDKKKTLAYCLSLIFIFICWIIVSLIVKSDLIFPSPLIVFRHLIELFKKSIFWQCFFGTFLRILISFSITIVLGSVLGFLCGLCKFFDDFFQIPLQIVRATPVIAIILIVIFWFKSTAVPVFINVLMTLPIMITSVATGFKQKDGLEDLSNVSGLSKFQHYFYIKLPLVFPFFVNGALQCFGLSWKVVLASEVLSLPKSSLGNLMQKAQMNLETSDITAITIFVVFVSFILEKAASCLVKKSKL